MLKKLFSGLFSGLLALALPACDAINLDKLKPGVSTEQDVRAIMGAPTMEWRDPDGTLTLEYARTPQGIVNYMIVLGPDKLLRAVRQVITEENFAKVQAGMSRDDIRRLLGQPASEQHFPLKKEHVWDWKYKVDSGMDYFFDVYFGEDGKVTRTGSHFNAPA